MSSTQIKPSQENRMEVLDKLVAATTRQEIADLIKHAEEHLFLVSNGMDDRDGDDEYEWDDTICKDVRAFLHIARRMILRYPK